MSWNRKIFNLKDSEPLTSDEKKIAHFDPQNISKY